MTAQKKTFLKSLIAILITYILVNFLAFQFFFQGPLTNYLHLNSFIQETFLTSTKNAPNSIFSSNVLILGGIKNLYFLIPFLLLLFPFVLNCKLFNWRNFEYHIWIKALTILVCFLLCWELTTYEYNYYLNSAFNFDRILLVLFLIGIYFHPFFIPCFLINALLYRSQFNFPIGGFPLFDKRVLFDLLILIYSFILISKYFKVKTVHLFFLVFCLIAGNYFSTFQAKIINSPNGIKWLFENRLDWFFLNANSKGWLSFLSNELIHSISHFLKTFSIPLQALILCFEGITVFILFKRSRSILIFTTLIIMHLIIFLFGSMLFWKWIAVDLFLIIFLVKAPHSLLEQLFYKENRLISVVLIISGIVLFKNFAIGWHDTPMNQFYTYTVTTENSKKYNFPKNKFNPYHQLIQHDKLHYINPNKIIKISAFGYTNNYKLAHFVRNNSWKNITVAENKLGQNFYSKEETTQFSNFIKTFFTNYNKRIDISYLPAIFSAPHHINDSYISGDYMGKLKIVEVEVFFNQFFIQNSKVELKNKISILKIKI